MKSGPGPDRPVESAINEILAAEKDALAEIAACERQAEEILRDARRTARRVLRRTQERLAGLHAGCAARTRDLVTEFEREAEALDACAVPGNEERALLDATVRAVAAELTSRDGDGD